MWEIIIQTCGVFEDEDLEEYMYWHLYNEEINPYNPFLTGLAYAEVENK